METRMKCKCMRTTCMDVKRSMGIDTDSETSGSCVTRWRKRHHLFAPRQRVIAAAILSCVLFAPSRSYSEPTSDHHEPVVLELSASDKHGETIARAREQVLEILLQGSACTAWFEEASSDPAEVFGSLHLELEESGAFARLQQERR
jgi:hypothetical protein